MVLRWKACRKWWHNSNAFGCLLKSFKNFFYIPFWFLSRRSSLPFHFLFFFLPLIDPPVVIPLTWPQGTYGLPMTIHGCPKAAGFTWHHGYRYHENEIGNSWSYPYHLAGKKSIWTNQQAFCIKTKDQGTKYDLNWSPGQYCLFKKGDCPEGLFS